MQGLTAVDDEPVESEEEPEPEPEKGKPVDPGMDPTLYCEFNHNLHGDLETRGVLL